jgi:hexosaminidase
MNPLILKIAILALVLSFRNVALAEDITNILPIIPKPVSLQLRDGVFTLSPKTSIRYNNVELKSEADYLSEYLKNNYHLNLPIIHSGQTEHNELILRLSDSEIQHPESYSMNVTGKGIVIEGDKPGVFYGIQTLIQILPGNNTGILNVPCVEIQDFPRFQWRGMHLDVCRHFFPKDFVKKYIDLLAMYKMNTFHWHLTDDQGWRVEIKKYPKLTTIGAFRNGSMIGPFDAQKFDSVRYGGFYTQDDVREIVAYARQRHVTIVPEIEMPGHCIAALASYPELSCTGGPFEVGKAWGVYDDVYCPKEETFEFLENVLSEVCELFPGKYIHIGGDEVPKDRWKKCAYCQALIKKEGLKDENELESYFIRRIEKFLNSKGKQIIGWDEILEGGIAPNAAVMSWRGTEGGIAAAKMKHHVVMTPGGYCYFDHYQGNPQFEPLAIGGYTTVEKVYSYEPVPLELTSDKEQYILGAQGNLWTEYINSPEQVEYMALPRMAALAEVDWTPKNDRDYHEFRTRLIKHFSMLDRMGVHYSNAIYEIQSTVRPVPDGNGVSIGLSSSFDSTGIYYTMNGDEPDDHSLQYRQSITITKNILLKYAYIKDHRRMGNVMEQHFFISQSTGKNIILKTPPHENYPGNGALTLVDGIRGDSTRFGQNWIGFWGPNLEAVIDLGKSARFSTVTIDFFNGEASWIYLPKSLEIFVSDDTLHWTNVKRIDAVEIKRCGQTVSLALGSQRARYVKVIAENAGKIPEGKPGAGNDSWLFVDEIMIE